MFREALAAEFLPYARLSPEQLDQLESHYDLLRHWNRTLNLTRIENELDVVRFHYCESLFLGLQLPIGPLRVADAGSGAGFPGIPIAILRSDLQLTLIESHRRKAVFLREAAARLANVTVFEGRAEDCGERFDWVVARAVPRHDVFEAHLAPRAALLMTRADARAGSQVIDLPWGRDRVIDVPRET